MSEMRLMASHTGQGHMVTCDVPGGGTMTLDGEGGAFGATPMQHLLAALCACTLMDVALILRKKRIAFSDLRAEAVGTRPDEGHPRPFTDIRLSFRVAGDVPAKAFDDAVRLSLETYCNVGATMRAGVVPTVDARVDAARGDAAAPPGAARDRGRDDPA